MEGVRKLFNVLLLATSAMVLCASCNRVSWPVSRELCGQIQIIDEQTKTVLRNNDLALYRSKSKYAACCAQAEKVADLNTDDEGDFNSGKLRAGRYFVVVKSSPEIAFPIFLERDSSGGNCGLNTVSFDRETRKTEQTVTVYIYSK
jgi:hypothetical protein